MLSRAVDRGHDRALLVLTAAVAEGPVPPTYIPSVITPSAGSGVLDLLELGGVHDIALSASSICESLQTVKPFLYAAGSGVLASWVLGGMHSPHGIALPLNNHMQVFEELVLRSETEIHPHATGSGVLDSWELGGVHSPHDIALSAAPVTATLGGSRSLAVYVAETAKGRASHLHKFIIHAPGAEKLATPNTQLTKQSLLTISCNSRLNYNISTSQFVRVLHRRGRGAASIHAAGGLGPARAGGGNGVRVAGGAGRLRGRRQQGRR